MDRFTFTTAFSYLMQGKRVRRHDWHRDAFVEVVGDFIEDESGLDFCTACHSSDILSDDWELVE